jgi:ribosome-associated protein
MWCVGLSRTPLPLSRRVDSREVVIDSEMFASALASAALEKKAFDLAAIDLRRVADFADVFVLCSARNKKQVQAIADEVRRKGKELTGRSPAMEGVENARWVLVDFGDVIVHVFDQQMRSFYDLEGLWKDGERLPVPESPAGYEQDDLFS